MIRGALVGALCQGGHIVDHTAQRIISAHFRGLPSKHCELLLHSHDLSCQFEIGQCVRR
jgi:hypothetical protein